jgi:putative phage-type endonuclease
MNKNLQLIDTRQMSRAQWLAYRKNGIGASEASTIMGLNPYKSSIQLFYEKIGVDITLDIENIHMFMGKFLEAPVANLWQYWEGTEESMIVNYNAGRIVRKCRRVNAYVKNPKYPWLFVSLDRVINKHADKPEGALEVKTINGYEADKWEAGIPPGHVIQVQQQCGVCEFPYGELATFKDGRRFEVTPFDLSPEIWEAIIEHTYAFWERILKGREILTQQYQAKRTFNFRAVEELTSLLASIEPSPDNSEAYADFMTSKFGKSTAGERAGTIIELQHALNHKNIAGQIATLEDKARLFENKLKAAMGEFERLQFNDQGHVSWKNDVNGTRRFINKIKS